MKSVREKNREQDFRDLEIAVRNVQDFLRSDEAHPDLYDQFPFRTDIGGCHRYYLEPYRSTFGSMLEKGPFVPFPAEIMQKYERIECASFMGIIPEINRVWITVDNQLYLWNYYQPEEYQLYDEISEVIVSVALSVPKPGIFLDTVKYLLVVATPVDIIILAICADEGFDQIKIVPTAYTLPSDNVTMIKIVGSELGRIFMIGNDKNLYELEYTISESAWAPILGTGPQRKCRKVNHFAWNWKLNNILPPIFRAQRDLIDEFTDIVIDNARNIVYTVTLGGELNAFYLYQGTDTPSLAAGNRSAGNLDFFLNSFNLFDECRRYCSSTRFAPQSSPHGSLFNDPFSSDGFIPIAMYPISVTESRKAHLLIILKNGIRIYLSLLDYRYGFDRSPRGLEVSYIRSPPSPESLDLASNPTLQTTSDIENGTLPSLNLNRQLSLGKTLATKGVFLFAIEKNQQPDELYGIFEDSMKRDHSVAASTNSPYHASQSYSLKEGISLALGSNISGAKVYDIKEVSSKFGNYSYAKLKTLFYQSLSPSDMNIRDQSHHQYPTLPGHGHSHNTGANWLGSLLSERQVTADDEEANLPVSAVLTESNALVPRTIATRAGVERADSDNFTILSELSSQHIPTHSNCTQRQILVLTSNGLQVLLKLRPADILFRCLIQHDSRTDDYVREFFANYGQLPSSLMCLGLAIGLPVDACGSRFANPIHALDFAPTVPLKTIQVRAMRAMFALNPGPSFRSSLPANNVSTANPAAATGGIQDNRVVVLGNTHEFQRSLTHDAFYWIASRLLRPIWFRAVFDPRTDQVLSDIWSVSLLEELRKPLEYLVDLLVTYYPTAITADSSQSTTTTASQAAKQMEGLDATRGSTTFITQQIAEQVRQQYPNTEKSLFLQAKQLEENSIRNLYLLLTRSLQAFAILEIFFKSIDEWKLPKNLIKLFSSALKGYSFRSIVLLPSIQEICKKQINQLISFLLTSEKYELAEIILQQLKTDSFYYFSSGDVYLIEANKLMNSLKQQHILPDYQGLFSSSSSSEIVKLVEQCCQYYLKASDFWNSIENISNTNESELKQTCNALLFLGKLGWETIVNICLQTANKFSNLQSAASSNDVYQLSNKQYSKYHQLFPSSPIAGGNGSAGTTQQQALIAVGNTSNDPAANGKAAISLLKDYHLFHGGIVLSEALKQEYQRHCYEILIDQILFTETNLKSVYNEFHQYQKLPNQFAEQISLFLLQYSLNKCSDRRYHELLYQKLYSVKSFHHRLLSINSPFIESFLRERNTELLYIYYMSTEYARAPEYLKAIDLMCGIASDPNEFAISYRIESIEKALTSADLAYQTLTQSTSSNGAQFSNAIGNKTILPANQSLESYLLDNIQQFKDMIAVAKYQERIGESLLQDYHRYDLDDGTGASLRDRYDEKTLRELDTMNEFIHQLQFQLVNLTTLYEIAFRYRMWEYNLLILQLSKQTDTELVQKLWKSYIYRLVPTKAKHSEVSQFLDSQRRDASKLFIDPRNQENRSYFEDHAVWLPQLFQQVLSLGKEVLTHQNKLLPTNNATNANVAGRNPSYLMENSLYFPIVVIIEEIEEILSYIRIPSIAATSSTTGSSTAAAAGEEKESIIPFQLLQEFRQHYSFGYQLIHHLQLSSSIIIEYYLQIFLRWKSKTYDKLLQLLMIIVYLLLEWIRITNEEVNNNQYSEDNWYCITMIRQGKLDKWLEILRSQLLSIQYRQIKESFNPFIEQLMMEMNQIQKYKESLTIYTKLAK